MERLDAIVAGLGILVVAAALGGVLATAPGAAPEHRVVFVEDRVPVEALQGGVTGDGSVELAFDAAAPNLTRVQVTVRVTGAGPRTFADAVEVTLDGPDGRSETQRATLGPGGPADATLVFERTLRPMPAEQRVRAATPEAAIARADPGPAANLTAGGWTVLAAITSGGPAPQLHVEGHTVVVEAVAFGFHGTVQPEIVPR